MIHVRAVLSGFLAIALPAVVGAQTSSADFRSLASEANTARIEKDLPRAIQLYGKALQLNGDWKEGWWYLGLLQYETDSYSAGRDAFTHYIAVDPSGGPAFALRGLCEFETSEYALAVQDLEHGMSLGAASQLHNEQILRYHEGLSLARLGRFQDALRIYAWFAGQEITSPELMEAIGLAGLRQSMLPKDIDDTQRSLFRATGNATFQYMARHENEAKAMFQELFQKFPSTANLHLLYGYLLFERDPVEATKEFTRELQISPSNAGANIMLAWAALMQNDASGALPYAQRAEQADSTLPIAKLVLGRALVGTGNLMDGTRYLERAKQLDPDNLEIHIALAQAYSEAGRKEDAWRERMQSLRLSGTDAPPTANP